MDVKEAFPPRLLIKMPRQVGADLERRPFGLDGTTFRLRPLCPNEATTTLGAAAASRWYLAEASPAAVSSADLWELAYKAASERGVPGAPGLYAEPDFLNPWLYENLVRPKKGFAAGPGETCEFNDQDGEYPQGPGFAWHLRDDFSQLKVARDEVNGDHPGPVRLGILDTGFDFSHQAKPAVLRLDLQRNFVHDNQPADDASDPFERGLFNNPGHGTGTIGILAGGMIATTGDFWAVLRSLKSSRCVSPRR
ncbi:MAG: hypothetical protein IPK78_20340 [Rhodospirillales bacterium]|nr:hypothetical protein [Rhodospirillales bacterium]